MTALTPYVSRNGAGTFSTALNFMEEYSGYTVSIPLQDHSPQSGRTQSGSNLYKSTKWTDPTKGQTYTSPQSGRTHQGSNLYKSTKWTNPNKGQNQSTKWTDPPRVKLIQVHKVNGPYQGSKPGHKVDGPH